MMPVDFGDPNCVNPYGLKQGNVATQQIVQQQQQQQQQQPQLNCQTGMTPIPQRMNAMNAMNPMTPTNGAKLSPTNESQWDWNKLFVPMQQVMQGMHPGNVIHEKDRDDFKYSSPFKRKTLPKESTISKDIKLNPDACSFKMSTFALNPDAKGFTPTITEEPEEEITSNNKEQQENKLETVSIVTKSVSTKKKSKKSRRSKLDINNDDTILAMHGYKKVKKMQKSLQGMLYLDIM